MSRIPSSQKLSHFDVDKLNKFDQIEYKQEQSFIDDEEFYSAFGNLLGLDYSKKHLSLYTFNQLQTSKILKTLNSAVKTEFKNKLKIKEFTHENLKSMLLSFSYEKNYRLRERDFENGTLKGYLIQHMFLKFCNVVSENKISTIPNMLNVHMRVDCFKRIFWQRSDVNVNRNQLKIQSNTSNFAEETNQTLPKTQEKNYNILMRFTNNHGTTNNAQIYLSYFKNLPNYNEKYPESTYFRATDKPRLKFLNPQFSFEIENDIIPNGTELKLAVRKQDLAHQQENYGVAKFE